MARVFITGSADGLGQLAAAFLVHHGHQVVLHARSQKRSQDAWKSVPGAETVLTGDLSRMEETKQLADDVNALGRFDAVIYNAGIYRGSAKEIFAVNTLTPYILTCLIHKPQRLIYLSSNMHLSGHPSLERLWKGNISYSDSKFYVVLLMKAMARKWPDVYANAVDPGWVPTKMGGPGAPDDLEKGFETQALLRRAPMTGQRSAAGIFTTKEKLLIIVRPITEPCRTNFSLHMSKSRVFIFRTTRSSVP